MCDFCNDTGSLSKSLTGYLDCPHCDTAEERAKLEAWAPACWTCGRSTSTARPPAPSMWRAPGRRTYFNNTAGGAGQNEELNMNHTNNGGPAFPLKEALTSDNEGMTLRDYFAAAALPAVIAAYIEANGRCIGTDHVKYNSAAHAYQFADAMLAERAK